MAVNPCVYCGAEVPEGYGHVCPNCVANLKNGAPPEDVGTRRNRHFRPIYKPSGRAREYGEYAINIHTGCNHVRLLANHHLPLPDLEFSFVRLVDYLDCLADCCDCRIPDQKYQ